MIGDLQPLGDVLRDARIRAGLTQRVLSERAGVGVRTIRQIERGAVRHPRAESVRRLTETLGLAQGEALVPDVGRRHDHLRIEVLGPLRAHRGVRQPAGGSVKQRCLLGILALQPNRPVGNSELIDVLWDERPPATSRNLVHTYVARLRRSLEPSRTPSSGPQVLVESNGGYRLVATADELDLLRFDELTAQARGAERDDPSAALKLMSEALGCWRGPLLADLPGHLRDHPAAVAIHRRRSAAVLAHADLAFRFGRPEQAVRPLQALAEEEPLHEGAHARLMLALAGSGQQAVALTAYERLRERLAEELGVEPSPVLREAHARVLRGDLPRPSPPAGAPSIQRLRPAQLPADAAGFTGRREHLARMDDLIRTTGRDGPTITVLCGMAGVGKTALAVHWAHRNAHRFPDGQLYVDLHGYAVQRPVEPIQALISLLRGLGVTPGVIPDEIDAAAGLFRSMLDGKRLLVVLDNAYDTDQVRPLLPGSPACPAIVTSRDRLTGLSVTPGADRMDLHPLDADEATALLTTMIGEDRAEAEPAAAAELARRCGHLPLALRIAAANLGGDAGRSIADQLTEMHEHGALSGLIVGQGPQEGVRTAFDQSYRHLGDDARRLFRLLGLVPGINLPIPAAAALVGVPPERGRALVRELAEVNLVELRGANRYGLHELLCQYARERSSQEDDPALRDAARRLVLDSYFRTADAAARPAVRTRSAWSPPHPTGMHHHSLWPRP